MCAKSNLLACLALTLAFNASAQLLRAPSTTAPAPAAAPAPESAPVAAPASPVTASAPTPTPQPAAPAAAGIAPASPEARESIGEQASRARAAATAPASEQVPAIAIRGAGQGGQSGSYFSRNEPAEPRLLSIVGQHGRERVEVAFDGFIYTVSRTSPRLGGTGWRLAEIDAGSSTVRLERGNSKDDGPKDKKATLRVSQHGLLLGFSRKDTDTSSDNRTPGR